MMLFCLQGLLLYFTLSLVPQSSPGANRGHEKRHNLQRARHTRPDTPSTKLLAFHLQLTCGWNVQVECAVGAGSLPCIACAVASSVHTENTRE